MKKMLPLAVMLAVMLAVTLAACGNKDGAAAIIPFSNAGTTLIGGMTLYLGVGRDSTTQSVVEFAVPRAGVIKAMHVKSNGSPGVGNTHIYTLLKNSADTALVVTVSGSNVRGANTTHEINVVAGDTVAVRVVASEGAGGAGNVSASVVLGE